MTGWVAISPKEKAETRNFPSPWGARASHGRSLKEGPLATAHSQRAFVVSILPVLPFQEGIVVHYAARQRAYFPSQTTEPWASAVQPKQERRRQALNRASGTTRMPASSTWTRIGSPALYLPRAASRSRTSRVWR